MNKLAQLIDRLKFFQQHLLKIVEDVVKENEHIILDMNSEEQLFEQGINRDGDSIDSYMPYTSVTLSIKKEKGQPTGRVTLRDSGDFHHSFYIEYGEDGFEIDADDMKTASLIKKYGDKILGLTDDNLEGFTNDYLKPEIQNAFKNLSNEL